jgi:hypothetical protein
VALTATVEDRARLTIADRAQDAEAVVKLLRSVGCCLPERRPRWPTIGCAISLDDCADDRMAATPRSTRRRPVIAATASTQ